MLHSFPLREERTRARKDELVLKTGKDEDEPALENWKADRNEVSLETRNLYWRLERALTGDWKGRRHASGDFVKRDEEEDDLEMIHSFM